MWLYDNPEQSTSSHTHSEGSREKQNLEWLGLSVALAGLTQLSSLERDQFTEHCYQTSLLQAHEGSKPK